MRGDNFAVPFSGGTSLEGNFSAPYGGITIDFSFMDKIVKFNQEEYVHILSFSFGLSLCHEKPRLEIAMSQTAGCTEKHGP
jgi:hypothetical protein